MLTPDCGNRAADDGTVTQNIQRQPSVLSSSPPIGGPADKPDRLRSPKPPKCTLLVPALVEVVLLLADELGRVGCYFKQSRCG